MGIMLRSRRVARAYRSWTAFALTRHAAQKMCLRFLNSSLFFAINNWRQITRAAIEALYTMQSATLLWVKRLFASSWRTWKDVADQMRHAGSAAMLVVGRLLHNACAAAFAAWLDASTKHRAMCTAMASMKSLSLKWAVVSWHINATWLATKLKSIRAAVSRMMVRDQQILRPQHNRSSSVCLACLLILMWVCAHHRVSAEVGRLRDGTSTHARAGIKRIAFSRCSQRRRLDYFMERKRWPCSVGGIGRRAL